ncbi:MAG: hypothetical protein J6W96_02125, partial [Alphaproteobacteria bacterium]|nr:hypothetical protein [Alphaproteobacteria bacterium]
MQTGNADKGKHALGGFIQIWPAKKFTKFTGSNNKYMYFIVFENLSQAACVELLTQGQFYGDGSDLDTIVVNRNINNFKNNSTSGIRFRYSKSLFWTDMKPTKTITLSPNKPSVTINDAFTACSKKTGNSILWVFS